MTASNLEEAAESALGRLKALDARLEASTESLAALRRAVADVGARVEEDWEPFAEAAQALVSALPELAFRIGSQAGAVGLSLRRVLRVPVADAPGGATAEMGEHVEASLSGAGAAVDRFQRWLAESLPPLQETQALLGTRALAAVTTRLAGLSGSVERSVATLRDGVMGTVKPDLEALGQGLAERVARPARALAEELLPAAEDEEMVWHSRLDEAQKAVQAEAFAAADQHAQTLLAEGHAARAQAAHDLLDAVAAEVVDAVATLGALTATVQATTRDDGEASEDALARLGAATGALRSAAGKLDDASGFLASRGLR
jgi:hypothetical protein